MTRRMDDQTDGRMDGKLDEKRPRRPLLYVMTTILMLKRFVPTLLTLVITYLLFKNQPLAKNFTYDSTTFTNSKGIQLELGQKTILNVKVFKNMANVHGWQDTIVQNILINNEAFSLMYVLPNWSLIFNLEVASSPSGTSMYS